MQLAKIKFQVKGYLLNSFEDCTVEIKLDKYLQFKSKNQLTNISMDQIVFEKDPNNQPQTIQIKNFNVLLNYTDEVDKYSELLRQVEDKSYFFSTHKKQMNINIKNQLSRLIIDSKTHAFQVKKLINQKDSVIDQIIFKNLIFEVFDNNLVRISAFQKIDHESQQNLLFTRKFDYLNKKQKQSNKFEVEDDEIIEFKYKNSKTEISLICSDLALLHYRTYPNGFYFYEKVNEELFIINTITQDGDHLLHRKQLKQSSEAFEAQKKQFIESHNLIFNQSQSYVKPLTTTKMISNKPLLNESRDFESVNNSLAVLREKQQNLLKESFNLSFNQNTQINDNLFSVDAKKEFAYLNNIQDEEESFESCINVFDEENNATMQDELNNENRTKINHDVSVIYDKNKSAKEVINNSNDVIDEDIDINDVAFKYYNDHKYRNQFVQSEKGVLETLNKDVYYNIFKKCFSNPMKVISNGFSPPIFCFIPKSFLQTTAEQYQYIIRNLQDIIETDKNFKGNDRFKNKQIMAKFTSLLVASLVYLCEPLKPFNPVWGETYTCQQEDGAQGCFEQVSHHPPIVSYYIEKPGVYRIQGSKELSYKFKLGWIEGYAKGLNTIELLAINKKQQFQEPRLALPGQLQFEMVWTWIGKLEVKDVANELTAMVHMDADNFINSKWKTGILGDRCLGYVTDNSKVDAIESEKHPITKLKSIFFDEDMIKLDGCVYNYMQLEYVANMNSEREIVQDIDNVEKNFKTLSIQDSKFKLASDSTLRPDIIALKKEDETLALKEKTIIETLQRHDRKLRSDYEYRNNLTKVE